MTPETTQEKGRTASLAGTAGSARDIENLAPKSCPEKRGIFARRAGKAAAIIFLRAPLMLPLALVVEVGHLADRSFEWLHLRLPGRTKL